MVKKHLNNYCYITARNISALVEFVRADIIYRLKGDKRYRGEYNKARLGHLNFILNLCVIYKLLVYMQHQVYKSKRVFRSPEIFMSSRRSYNHNKRNQPVGRQQIIYIKKQINYCLQGYNGPWNVIQYFVIRKILHTSDLNINDLINLGNKILDTYYQPDEFYTEMWDLYKKLPLRDEAVSYPAKVKKIYFTLTPFNYELDKFGYIHKIFWIARILKFIHNAEY